MKKAISILSISIIVLILCCGCINHNSSKNGHSTSSQIQMAKDLLRDKYGEEFEISAIGGRYGTLSNTTYKVNCYPVNNPDIVFDAEIDKSGTYMFDEYVSRIACNELKKNILKNSDFSSSVFVASVPSELEINDSSISINELISQNDKLYFVVYLLCPNSTTEDEIVESIKNSLSSYPEIDVELYYYLTDDDKVIDEFNELAKKKTTLTSDMMIMLKSNEEHFIMFENGLVK